MLMIPLYQVDAFTSEPFAGNPAAVCVLSRTVSDEWMQRVASEMNLSETAFVTPREDGSFELRWMTPEVEVDLCGHATLAAAHTLFTTGRAGEDAAIRFHSRSGLLEARKIGTLIELDFPAKPAHEAPGAPLELLQPFAEHPTYVGRNDFDYLIELPTEQDVRGLAPDLALWKKLGVRGIVVTARADAGRSGYDFVSRGFFPGSGVDEDPVTGSAHCMLGPYWMPRLERAEMTGYQASRRGGYVSLTVMGERVKLRGEAVTVMEGRLCCVPE